MKNKKLIEIQKKQKSKNGSWDKKKAKRKTKQVKERKEWSINTKQENVNVNRSITAPPIGFNGHDFNSKYARLSRQAVLVGIDFGEVYTDLIREKRKNGKQINNMDILGELERSLFHPENPVEEPEPVI